MVHLSAASDGGERGRVVVDDDSRPRPRTVWHLTRDMGDDMSPGCHASPCERQEAHTLPGVLEGARRDHIGDRCRGSRLHIMLGS